VAGTQGMWFLEKKMTRDTKKVIKAGICCILTDN
jgi:hypothetical protein